MKTIALGKTRKMSISTFIIIMAAAVLNFGLAGPAISAEMTCPAPPCLYPPPLPIGMMILLDTININVVARLTGEPAAAVKQRFAYDPGHALLLLKQKGIPFDAYRKAMDEQSALLINQAASSKIISPEQANETLKEMRAVIARMEAQRAEEEILKWKLIGQDLEE